jgi:AraC family L-rhamnose operon transcriptional activator RhaR/AraC family L-rhamnose operon regulatory protein RhaS
MTPKKISLAPRPSGFSLLLSRLTGSSDVRVRKDPMARLVLVHAGEGDFQFAGKVAHPVAGSILLVPPAAPHQLVCDDSFSWTLIRLDPEQAKMRKWDIAHTREFQETFSGFGATGHSEQPADPRHLQLLPRHFDQATALAGEIERELSERPPGWRDLSMSHFQHLVIVISRHAGKDLRISDDATRRVAAAIRHIEYAYDDEVNFCELAAMCGMSERTFYRIFKQATGQTPQTYLKRVRVDHAAEALRSTDKPVTEIAFAVGFEDSNFFAREFRKTHGFAPSEYRKRWQE